MTWPPERNCNLLGCGAHDVKYVLSSLLFAAAHLVAAPVQAGMQHAYSISVTETVVLLDRDGLRQAGKGSPIVRTGRLRVDRRAIGKACFRLARQSDELLIYNTATGDCRTLSAFEATLPSRRLDFGLSGTAGVAGIDSLLEPAGIATISPLPAVAAGPCACPGPGNSPPSVAVQSGSPQTVDRGETIAEILFRATDADGDTLQGSLSYVFDTQLQDGLPPGLAQSCSSSAGLLQCGVTGTAPDTPGLWQIRQSVSDGKSSASATASLEVRDPVRIFIDGFENP